MLPLPWEHLPNRMVSNQPRAPQQPSGNSALSPERKYASMSLRDLRRRCPQPTVNSVAVFSQPCPPPLREVLSPSLYMNLVYGCIYVL